MLTSALESGFNSIAPFKELVGQRPTAYRRDAAAEKLRYF